MFIKIPSCHPFYVVLPVGCRCLVLLLAHIAQILVGTQLQSASFESGTAVAASGPDKDKRCIPFAWFVSIQAGMIVE